MKFLNMYTRLILLYTCVQCFRDLRGIVQNDSITSHPISLHHVLTLFRGVFRRSSLALAPIVFWRFLRNLFVCLSLSLFYTFAKVSHDTFRRVALPPCTLIFLLVWLVSTKKGSTVSNTLSTISSSLALQTGPEMTLTKMV